MKKNKGFTLIETIVVIAVIGITLPVLFAIIITMMRQQVKIYRLSQIKREGDYLLSLMENTIRDNALTIIKSTSPIPPDNTNEVCTDNTDPYSSNANLYFLDKDSQLFGYELNGNTIASASSSLDVDLTSSKIVISSFSISCSRNTIYSPPSISIAFDICYETSAVDCATSRPEEVASMHYQARIKLRNY